MSEQVRDNGAGFAHAAGAASSPNYLGTPDVVEGLFRQAASDMLSADNGADEADAWSNRFADVYMGVDRDYVRISPEPITSDETFRRHVATRLGYNPSSLDQRSMLKFIFLMFASQVGHAAQRAAEAAGEDGDPDVEEIDSIVEFFASLMMGTLDVTHPVD